MSAPLGSTSITWPAMVTFSDEVITDWPGPVERLGGVGAEEILPPAGGADCAERAGDAGRGGESARRLYGVVGGGRKGILEQDGDDSPTLWALSSTARLAQRACGDHKLPSTPRPPRTWADAGDVGVERLSGIVSIGFALVSGAGGAHIKMNASAAAAKEAFRNVRDSIPSPPKPCLKLSDQTAGPDDPRCENLARRDIAHMNPLAGDSGIESHHGSTDFHVRLA